MCNSTRMIKFIKVKQKNQHWWYKETMHSIVNYIWNLEVLTQIPCKSIPKLLEYWRPQTDILSYLIIVLNLEFLVVYTFLYPTDTLFNTLPITSRYASRGPLREGRGEGETFTLVFLVLKE